MNQPMKPAVPHIKLKVCGMRDPENIRAIGSLEPHYMGFIFYKPSPRYVGENFVVPADIPASVIPVGVFVNETTEQIIALASHAGIRVLQLHGAETPQQCQALKDHGYTLIKVFSVGEEFDFSVTEPYEGIVHYFLFDTRGKYHGGNARTFNWSLLQGYHQRIPFFLSGGLTPDNIEGIDTLRHMNLHALDINSGVEISPGLKDYEQVKQAQQKITLSTKS